QAKRRAALGATRLGGGTPRKCIKMRPRRVFGNEALQEERGGDRPRKGGTSRIAEVGDVGFEQIRISVPQGHAPDGIVTIATARNQLVRKRVVICKQRWQVGAERYPTHTPHRREITTEQGPALPR